MDKEINCPHCEGKAVIKKGFQVGRRVKQVYYCKSCGKKFVQPGLRKKVHDPKVILEAISLYNSGLSLKEVTERIYQKFRVRISKSSVGRWVKQFSDACKFLLTRKLRLQGANKGQAFCS